jgi:hypothetical protein
MVGGCGLQDGCGCTGLGPRRGELGEEGGESFGGERIALAVEIVDAHVAEILDVCAELVCCGGHEVIVKVGN